jgi:hypothetical protein
MFAWPRDGNPSECPFARSWEEFSANRGGNESGFIDCSDNDDFAMYGKTMIVPFAA